MSDLDYPSYGARMPDDFPAPESWDQVLHQPDYSFDHRPEARRPTMAFRPRGRTGPQYAPAPPYGSPPQYAPDGSLYSEPATTYQPWYPPVPEYPPAPDYAPDYAPGYPPAQNYPPQAPAGYWPPAPGLLSPAPPAGPAAPPPLAGRVLWWLPFGRRLILLPKSAVDADLNGHRDVAGGWLRPAVFGAMDGLVTNSSLIAGVAGGGGGHGAIVLTGVARLIAGAFSMATGEYSPLQSQNELNDGEI